MVEDGQHHDKESVEGKKETDIRKTLDSMAAFLGINPEKQRRLDRDSNQLAALFVESRRDQPGYTHEQLGSDWVVVDKLFDTLEPKSSILSLFSSRNEIKQTHIAYSRTAAFLYVLDSSFVKELFDKKSGNNPPQSS